MTIVTVQRATIKLGDIELEVFRLPNGEYRLSEDGCENAINAPERDIRDVRRSKSLDPEARKALTEGKNTKIQVFGERTRIKPIPLEFAVAYWGHRSLTGNRKAIALLMACAHESLQRRADAAFEVAKSEGQYNEKLADFLERWYPVRDNLRESHTPFMSACRERKHHGWQVHDAMTLLIWGETAAVARMKKIIAEDLDPTIGLNYQGDIEKMKILTKAKWIYARFTRKNEPWEAQVERAVAKAQQK